MKFKVILPVVALVWLGFVGLGAQQQNFPVGAGSVNANSGSAGAVANYAAAGGSTTVGPDAALIDNGTNWVSTEPLQVPVGTVAVPGLQFTTHLSSGLFYASGHGPCLGNSSVCVFDADANQGAVIADGNSLLFSPNNDGSAGKIVIGAASPTIASGFGSTPSVTIANTTASFRINVGTGGTATVGVIGMATAPTGWNCSVSNLTAHAGNRADDTVETASATNSVSVQNQTKSTGAAIAWTANDILALSCFPN